MRSGLVGLVMVMVMVMVMGCSTDAACPMTVEAYCAANGGCPMTLDAARDLANYPCTTCQSGSGCIRGTVYLATCAQGSLATQRFIDTGEEYSYDASGRLVQVAHFVSPGGVTCLAGTESAPSCDAIPTSVGSALVCASAN